MRQTKLHLDEAQRALLLRALEARGELDSKLRRDAEHEASDVHDLICVAMSVQNTRGCPRRDYATASAAINKLTDVWIALVSERGKQLEKEIFS